MDPCQDTESLVRLTLPPASDTESVREEKEEVSEEVVGKCEEVVRRPMPQHVMEKKPPWMSSLLPTPLLPLPTLNFTVSQVALTTISAIPNQIFCRSRISLGANFYPLFIPHSDERYSPRKNVKLWFFFFSKQASLPWLYK